MREPRLYKAKDIKTWSTSRMDKTGWWIPARPWGLTRIVLRYRLRLTWGVFTGRYDALDWEEDR